MAKTHLLFAIMTLALLSGMTLAYTTSIRAPAVLANENKGTMTTITLNLTAGSGNVNVTGPTSVDSTTLQSAQQAVAYAVSYLHADASQYNFKFNIADINTSVSGPSAGAAFTLLTIAALEHTQLSSTVTMSGTIDGSGNIGIVGGIYDKVGAAKAANLRYFLLPTTQQNGFLYLIYYIAQQAHSMPIVEVSNVSQALPYAINALSVQQLVFNDTTDYHVGALPASNVTCFNCNTTAFRQFAEFTANFTSDAISTSPNYFSSLKQAMLSNQDQYRQIESKGYLYTAADLSFLQYLQAYVMYNAGNYSTANTSRAIANVESYCSSITPPMLTTENYEFVVGGEARQAFADIMINTSINTLNNSETTDDNIEALNQVSQAMAWCRASSELYDLASHMGTNYVSFGPSLKAQAAAAIDGVRAYSGSIYYSAAVASYNRGDYAAALYSATYAGIFGNGQATGNLTEQQEINYIRLESAFPQNGTWPSQFMGTAQFWTNEAALETNASTSSGDVTQGYLLALLAKGLKADNSAIAMSFVSVAGVSSPAIYDELAAISARIDQIYVLMTLLVVLVFATLFIAIIAAFRPHLHHRRRLRHGRAAMRTERIRAGSRPRNRKAR